MTPWPVHVVVVAYHAPESLDRALSGLGGEFPVSVVDNSQSEGVRRIARHHSATLIDAGGNVGFAAGVNLALRRVLAGPPHHVLLLNPDAVIPADGVRRLAAALDTARSHIGSIAPRLVEPDGRPQRVLWPLPSPGRAWLEALGFGRLPARELFAIGAVLLLRWEALHAVGLFDERFFLYAEEADWQRRALAYGWLAALSPEVSAVHQGAGMSDDPLRREVLFHAAQETFIRKWYGVRGWSVYRPAVCAGALVRAVLRSGERRRAARRCARLYLRGPCRAAVALRR